VTEQADRQRAALHRMAKDDPELAGRLILMTLPGAASKIGGTMSYVLDVKELGAHRVSAGAGTPTPTSASRPTPARWRTSPPAGTGRSG
jgi:hypothetical protein